MLRDRDGAVWVATSDRGLIHFHQGKTDNFSEADGLSGDTVNQLLQDQEGDVWVVTTNGIDRFREYAVPNIGIKQGLSNANTLSVLASSDGRVWIGTHSGLNKWKNGQIFSVVLRGRWNDSFRISGQQRTHLGVDARGIRISRQRSICSRARSWRRMGSFGGGTPDRASVGCE